VISVKIYRPLLARRA